MNLATFTAPTAFAALALGAALLFAPAASSPVKADACSENVFTPECAKQMAYNVCIAGGGTPESCKPKEEARGPSLGVKAPQVQPVVSLQRRR